MTETEKWINETLKNLPHLCAEIRRLSEENDALRAQQEAEKNAPLTLDELKSLNGEPVWVDEIKTGISYWVLAGAIETGVVMIHFEGIEDFGAYACYGKTWMAYRRKPEEDAR